MASENPFRSPLEYSLLDAPSIDPSAEHEIDILRSVLVGDIGTQDQRSMLIRIIQQNKPRRLYTSKLAKLLGAPSTKPTLGGTYMAPRF